MKTANNVFIAALHTLLLTLFQPAQSERKITDFLSLEAVLLMGLEYEEFGYPYAQSPYRVYNDEMRAVIEGEFDIDLRFTDQIYAALDFRGDIGEPGFEVRKAYIHKEWENGRRIRFGNMKKDFSLEEMRSRHELTAMERSLPHRIFETFFILDHDLSLHYRREREWPDDKEFWYSVNTGLDGNQRYFGNAAANFEWEKGELTTAFLASLSGFVNSFFLVALGYEFPFRRLNLEVELFGGSDPNATEIAERIGESRTVYLGAVRSLISYAFEIEKTFLYGIEPLLGAALVIPDFEESGVYEAQFVPGINLHFLADEALMLKINADFVLSNDRPERDFGQRQMILAAIVLAVW